ncbi:AAA family ATPase [Caulobacter sp. 602-2]|uniref:AAA family ATPase n=1 Tax=Caulobacter sp. 602-2 TaxID=2710887 RepID=A0A6G4QTZ4_9CAUL|nr:TniB family NTP-binding protein [Caulobacter sp. 602-2]NGM48428.1 AAA family ATPase [Caulobacter sp. 602-2]
MRANIIPQAARLLEATNATRFSFIERDKVIETPIFNLIQARLGELVAHHRVIRPPNLAIVGVSGIGKTHAITDFVEHRKPRRSPDGRLKVPVLHAQYPPLTDSRWLARALVKKLGYQLALPRGDMAIFELLVDLLEEADTRLIIIEELNQLVDWPRAQVREFYGVARWLSNESQIPIVLSGTDEVLDLIDGDVQLTRRFERLQLPPWKLDETFAGFVSAYLQTIPLRNETLIDRSFIEQVHEAGQGITDTTVKILQRAAKRAILDGTELIESRHIISDATLPPPTAGKRLVARRVKRRRAA